MDVAHVAQAVVQMASLVLDANIQFMRIMVEDVLRWARLKCLLVPATTGR
jgi:hypothetical protein